MDSKLNASWTVWGVDNSFIGNTKSTKDFAETIGIFNTIGGFWQHHKLIDDHIRKLAHNNMFSVMRGEESPKWEIQEKKGRPGRVAIRINLKDVELAFKTIRRCFEDLLMLGIGETLTDIEGVTVCNKRVSYVIYAWNTGMVANNEFCASISSALASSIAGYEKSVTIDYHPFYGA
jgi:hypothetical protein